LRQFEVTILEGEMNEFMALSGPLIGMLGVVIGTLLNEYLRRSRRVEGYSSDVFRKRLEAYETLMSLIHDGSELARKAIDDPDLSPEERHDLISTAIHPIAQFVDRNVIYIDEELGSHCVALFMGTEDIHDAPQSEKQKLLEDYYKMLQETYRMIREDSGVAQVNKLFRSINRPKITSPVIERIRYLRREQQRTKK
jgi:hypothetical protein